MVVDNGSDEAVATAAEVKFSDEGSIATALGTTPDSLTEDVTANSATDTGDGGFGTLLNDDDETTETAASVEIEVVGLLRVKGTTSLDVKGAVSSCVDVEVFPTLDAEGVPSSTLEPASSIIGTVGNDGTTFGDGPTKSDRSS